MCIKLILGLKRAFDVSVWSKCKNSAKFVALYELNKTQIIIKGVRRELASRHMSDYVGHHSYVVYPIGKSLTELSGKCTNKNNA